MTRRSPILTGQSRQSQEGAAVPRRPAAATPPRPNPNPPKPKPGPPGPWAVTP